MIIPLIKPFITKEVKDKVIEVLDSGYLTEGKVTKELESVFQKYIGCKYAIAVTSCTTGLEVALRCLGIGPGDEVIVPDYTYPATAAVVTIVGAKAVITDVSKETMLIDYDLIEEAITSKTKAIIPVSLFGNPLDYDRLNQIKEKYNIYIIEDAACSIGAEYKGTKVGNLADISVFSLHPRKFITTGEGGIITTNNQNWADWMNSYKHFGIINDNGREGIIFENIGTNYKLSNVLAAIGLIQMKHIDELLDRRIQLSDHYFSLLKNISEATVPVTTPSGKHNSQSFCIYIENRNTVMKHLRDKGIEVQIGTYALHKYNAFNNNTQIVLKYPFNGSNFSFEHCLTLPLYHDLTFEQQRIIVTELKKLF
ncbi:MAG: DegT/DnrJ/EryC1/StrS aminotransferase family protein [Bacteroidia bacterium]|nr:DegT/DnrJ/EryC1/StrS aminotransferase family protein [Bacteroidia bacterium]